MKKNVATNYENPTTIFREKIETFLTGDLPEILIEFIDSVALLVKRTFPTFLRCTLK
jgi:hypothetical protein